MAQSAKPTQLKPQTLGAFGSLATRPLGRFDVVDIIEANDPKQVEKAAMIIRAFGHSSTETLVATPWKEFLGTLLDGHGRESNGQVVGSSPTLGESITSKRRICVTIVYARCIAAK